MENGKKFSPELIERLRVYFKNNYDKDISNEETIIFLGSLGRTYAALFGKSPSPNQD